MIEGEGKTAVFVDGSAQGIEDGLAFELCEKFKCENILRDHSRRFAKMFEVMCYLTEYDQSIFNIKKKEDGVEHKWVTSPEIQNLSHIKWQHSNNNQIVQSSVWQTLFQMDN